MLISPTNRKFLIAYVLLVGLPLLGLVGVLKAGRGLAAPVSVDGNWKVVAEGAAGPCVKSLSAMQDSLLNISQSGKGLVLSLDSATKGSSAGVIEGTTINAVLPQADSASDCSLTLLATVDPKTIPRSIEGTASVGDCPACAPVKWRAVRQARPTGKGAH